jgi:hypothetical protein
LFVYLLGVENRHALGNQAAPVHLLVKTAGIASMASGAHLSDLQQHRIIITVHPNFLDVLNVPGGKPLDP